MDDLKQVIARAIEQFADENGYMDIATDDADLFTSAVLAAIHASGHRIVPVKMVAAFERLNAELDAYWNDPTQAGSRPSEYYIQAITNAQIECGAMLTAYGQKGE